LLQQHEMRVGATALDGMGRDIASHAKMPGVRLIAHGMQFANGDVIALVRLNSGVRQIADGAQDNDGGCGYAEYLGTNFHCFPKGRSARPFRQALAFRGFPRTNGS
jgi:hypothetical protein